MSNELNKNSLVSDKIKAIVCQVLTNFKYTSSEIENILKHNKIINSLTENETVLIDFKIVIPYKDKEHLFDFGEVLKTAHQEEIILSFSNQAKLKEVKIVYRDDANASNLIIILDSELKYYDFIIRMDDINAIVKKEATIRIKENLLNISNLFQSHKSILISMIDDILYDENNYFKIAHTQINPITSSGVNRFSLETTAIYSGIISQYTPLKINYGSALNLTYNEVCEIIFDENQNIEKVIFKIHKNRNGKLENIKISLNKKLEIISVTWKILDKLTYNGSIFERKFNHHKIPIKDVFQLIRLQLNLNESIREILPEITEPSAYNFNTEEFADRLKIVEMMLD